VSSPARSALPGSQSRLPAGGQARRPVHPDERIEVSVTVRPRRPLEDLDRRLDRATPGEQPYLSREEFAATYGADGADLAKVEAFAREHGLEVVESSPARRTVRLAGRAADMNRAFGVELMQYQFPDASTFRGFEGEIWLPADLQGVVQGVFGLDDHPIARRDAH
jgi:kumamolisin